MPLPEKFMERYGHASYFEMFGVPSSELTREELLAVIAYMHEQEAETRRNFEARLAIERLSRKLRP